jgi:hypothetical protein
VKITAQGQRSIKRLRFNHRITGSFPVPTVASTSTGLQYNNGGQWEQLFGKFCKKMLLEKLKVNREDKSGVIKANQSLKHYTCGKQ